MIRIAGVIGWVYGFGAGVAALARRRWHARRTVAEAERIVSHSYATEAHTWPNGGRR